MSTTSSAMDCDVPPLSDTLRFSTAAYRGMTEWLYHLMLAEWELEGRPRSLREPCVVATVAEDLITHGPALWERVRAAFGGWYYGVYGAEEHFIAEHRFWAVLRLRDMAAESILQPWIQQEQPFLLSPMLLAAAAQARLTLHRASMDEPLDERSRFDLPDLVARAEAAHAQAVAETKLT